MAAASRGSHLGLGEAVDTFAGWRRAAWRPFAISLSTSAVTAWLLAGAADFVHGEVVSAMRIGGWLPIWVAELALPVGLVGMLAAEFLRPGASRFGALVGLGAGLAIALALRDAGIGAALVVVALFCVAFLLGAPIYVLIGGAALALFTAVDVPAAAVAVEAMRLATSPIIPAIPLFTLVGFLMTASRASERLIEVFQALFGWIPGGVALAGVLVCVFFASFTGSSGVVILAVGGLLVPVLRGASLDRRFALGLVTSSGSAGLLVPPSLALILFAVVAQIPILDLFLAALLPAALIVLGIGTYALWHSLGREVARLPFDAHRAGRALWRARWELMTPVIALGGIFSGLMTLLEAAAITVAYTLGVRCLVHREIDVRNDLGAIILRSSILIGGVFVILSMAMGLTSFMIDAQVPDLATEWALEHIGSKVAFLLVFNLILLIAGCLMDVFSAIAVLAPLLMPIGAAFGLGQVHLAIVFLANLELGYLTPPVGLNLYFAAYRFGTPLTEIISSVLPFLVAMLLALLVVSYLPLVIPFPGF